MRISFSFLLDALLLVAPGIQVKVEVAPLIPRREGDRLPKGEANCIDDAFPAGLAGAHADGGASTGSAEEVGRGRKVVELPVVHDALPNNMAELLRDFEAHQILDG